MTKVRSISVQKKKKKIYLSTVAQTPEFAKRKPKVYPRSVIERIHSPELLYFYENIWDTWCYTRGTPLVLRFLLCSFE